MIDRLAGDMLVAPPIDADKYLRNRRAAGLDDADPRARQSDTSLGMRGKIAVVVMFVESNGTNDPDTYTWTKAMEDQVLASVNNGLDWLTERAAEHGTSLSFSLYSYRHDYGTYMQQGYEPVLRPSSEAEYWVTEVMRNLGYQQGDHLSRVAAYNDWLCARDDADAAISMFACCNPSPAPTHFSDGYGARSYHGGPYLYFVGRTYSTTPLDMIIAHELEHSFHACDEYAYSSYGGCSRCDVCDIEQVAYPNPHGASNGNCEACNTEAVPCIMRGYTWNMCSYTAAQLGWGQPATPQPSIDPPVIAAIEDASISYGTAYSYTPSLLSGTSPVSWSLVAGPTDMAVDASTGRVEWPVPAPADSSQLVTLRASNAAGVDDESWTLTVGSQPAEPRDETPAPSCGPGVLGVSLGALVLVRLTQRRFRPAR